MEAKESKGKGVKGKGKNKEKRGKDKSKGAGSCQRSVAPISKGKSRETPNLAVALVAGGVVSSGTVVKGGVAGQVLAPPSRVCLVRVRGVRPTCTLGGDRFGLDCLRHSAEILSQWRDVGGTRLCCASRSVFVMIRNCGRDCRSCRAKSWCAIVPRMSCVMEMQYLLRGMPKVCCVV